MTIANNALQVLCLLVVIVMMTTISTTTFFCGVEGAVHQGDQGRYLATFEQIMAASYSQVDDTSPENTGLHRPPAALLQQCKNRGKTTPPTREITVMRLNHNNPIVSSSSVQQQCGTDTICIIPHAVTVQMDTNLNVGALIIRGGFDWTTTTTPDDVLFLCGGYIVVEHHGAFDMELDTTEHTGWIYIKNNGASHPQLRSRAFGTYKAHQHRRLEELEEDHQDAATSHTTHPEETPTLILKGRTLARTWSLLAEPVSAGMTTLQVLHDPIAMGWQVGDRLAIAPTDAAATGWGETVRITALEATTGTITFTTTTTTTGPSSSPAALQHAHRSDFEWKQGKYVKTAPPALVSAEVINLTRNIILTGDDFEEIPCDPTLQQDEAVLGEQTSVQGCRCADFRTSCTVGLHSMSSGHGGLTQIENIRVEKCGQRGIEGKYCQHFHQMQDCPDCILRKNAIENSQQRGIIVHGTHNALVEHNVLYNVRGANIYLEDGNEMWNTLAYNVAICPFPFADATYHGCTVPGTSNRIADTADNQAGFFSRAGSNNYIGNRAASHFNGMFLAEGSIGRGSAYNKVCESAARLGRMDGNTWHDNGRFGTYTLGFNYPKVTDQAVATNGYNVNKDYCAAFDANGTTQGQPGAFVNHVDYGNSFVGHYSAGDIQHYGHYSIENSNLMYWKETKTFENGCGSHLMNGYYAKGNLLLPDQATFIIDNTVIGEDTMLEANHHCNVGTTGVLCMPTYVLHKVKKVTKTKRQPHRPFLAFQKSASQQHNANQNHGGIFTLSPDDAAIVKSGGTVEDSIFPSGFISLVSDKFPYLLGLPNNLCIDTGSQYGNLYDNGIMCKTELRALKIYTRGLRSGSAPQLRVEIWYNNSGGNAGQQGNPDSSQLVGFHQVGSDGSSEKQGYSVPVIPGKGHSYKISLTTGYLPQDWVIEFSDPVIGNRWSEDALYLNVAGRNCGNNGLVSSQHDRKFIWGGNLWSGYLDDRAWSNHGACVGSGQQPPNEPSSDCSVIVDTNNNNKNSDTILIRQLSEKGEQQEDAGIIEATQCPEKCEGGCNSNSYCDCGLETCQCKAGFTGQNCEVDVCADANCGDHGSCSARYLGGDLPPTNKICICEESWLGERCDKNPCANIDCSGNGYCIAVSENEATCECEDGFLGAMCEERSQCEGFCVGEGATFPYFGCAPDVQGQYALGCFKTGGCYYLGNENDEYPYDGFCTYKVYNDDIILSPTPTPPAGSPVQRPPTPSPILPQNPVAAPTLPTPSPVSVSTPTSNNDPTTAPRCGCSKCSDDVWNTLAGDYSCGDRIRFLTDADEATLLDIGISSIDDFNEEDACRFVTDEFPDICTCACEDDDVPTRAPTPNPTTESPVAESRCGCTKCTNDVWNALATDGDGTFSCGNRINWMKENEGMDKAGACRYVTDEFPDICTCTCDDDDNNNPIPIVESTLSPTATPICGCFSCTDSVLNNNDANGHSCGARIDWLQTSASERVGGPYDEYDSCRKVSGEFPEECGRFCHPDECDNTSFVTENNDDGAKYCGIASCSDTIWNTDADGYSCGGRIEWLQTSDAVGGPYNEDEACHIVGEEFPEICGQCSGTHSRRRKVLRGNH